MPWMEFSSLLSGLNEKTQLGKIISIRTETDKKRLEHFTPAMKKIRREWQAKCAREAIKNNPDIAKKQIQNLQAAMKAAFFKPEA